MSVCFPCINASTLMYDRLCVLVCKCVLVHVCVCVRARACVCVDMLARVHALICVCVCVWCMYVCVCGPRVEPAVSPRQSEVFTVFSSKEWSFAHHRAMANRDPRMWFTANTLPSRKKISTIWYWPVQHLVCSSTRLPAKTAADAQGVLVGVWLLVTFRCHWIASQQQVLCSAFSRRQVLQGAARPRYWICEDDFCTTQRWIRRKRRILPTAVKAEEVVQDLCDPTVDQAEEENSQRLWKRKRLHKTYATQRWIRRKRRKLPTAVTADEVAQVIFCPNGGSGGRGEDSQRLWRRKRTYMSIYDPTVEQAEEEKAPNGYEGGWGRI